MQPTNYVTTLVAWRHGETGANKTGVLSGGGPDDTDGLKALNEEGRKQAEELGSLIITKNMALDVVYTSDLSRAIDTANAVLAAFAKSGKSIELRESMQLREILHGQYELTDAKIRKEAAGRLFQSMLEADQKDTDKYRFWKVNPLTADVVEQDVVDVADYIKRGEKKPETPFKLWNRVRAELIRIAQVHPGNTVGLSVHGGVLATLLDGLNKQPKGVYLPPHYHTQEIAEGGKVLMPAAVKVNNCALFVLKYDSKTAQLDLVQE